MLREAHMKLVPVKLLSLVMVALGGCASAAEGGPHIYVIDTEEFRGGGAGRELATTSLARANALKRMLYKAATGGGAEIGVERRMITKEGDLVIWDLVVGGR